MKSSLTALIKDPTPSPEADLSRPIQQSRSGGSQRRTDWRARGASLLPWALVIGFLLLLFLMLGERLLPARELSIASVVTVRQNADAQSKPVAQEKTEATTLSPEAEFNAPLLFQASGWIEPDPYAVTATALTDGVLESVHILEGELVKKGQLLAKLIDDDAQLDLETAQQQLASLHAQAEAHRHQIAIAEAELETLKKQVAAAEARRAKAAELADRLSNARAGVVPERDIVQAQLEVDAMTSEIEALATTETEIKARIEQYQTTCEDFSARIAQAQTEVDRRQLALDRTRIESPSDGRVLRLMAAPGHKKMLGMDDHHSASVAVLYDPENLQARIDVPLSEAANLTVGQAVRIRSELLPDQVFRARVTRILGQADLQRNTLQAKVAIENPDDRLRPDMLCRAEFLRPVEKNEASKPESVQFTGKPARARVFVPLAAIGETETDQDDVVIWKVDASGNRISRQTIVLGKETREDHRLALDGLKPGDRVVLNPPSDLEQGERFRATHDDNTETPSLDSKS